MCCNNCYISVEFQRVQHILMLGENILIKIHFIVPYPELKQVLDVVFNNHRYKDKLIKTVSVVGVDEIAGVHLNDCDVVIARGYAARYLRASGIEIPIVDIVISGYDVFRSVQECKELYQPRKVAFIGFYSAFTGVEDFSNMLGCKLKIYNPKDYDEVDVVIKQALKDGCDVVIGGQYVVGQAKKMGINSILIKTGEEAIYTAIDEAVRTHGIISQERIKSKMYQIITQSSNEGILYIDENKVVNVSNKTACNILGISGKEHTLSGPLTVFSNEYAKVISSGEEINGELKNVGSVTISVDYTPVIDNGDVAGVVISFQNITKVQQLEVQIRRKLSSKGLYAKYNFKDIIHSSKLVKDTIEIAKRYAVSSSNIMLVGETGTGKELFAQSIHNSSERSEGPFVAVNCAALTENLLESELFGYVEGAFTGAAKKGKMGLFELAHNGTLFLDEIGEISLSMQSKLLRVLQEKEVRRIGDDKVISVDARIICATNKNLRRQVLNGVFRQDLLYRLDVLKIFIPPLRARGDDVKQIFEFLINRICEKNGQNTPDITQGALEVLQSYDFLGNIRELRNIAERVNVIRLEDNFISKEDMERALFPDDVDDEIIYMVQETKKVNEDEEIKNIKKALSESRGNQTKAAKILGVDRSTLWRKINKYGLK